VHVSGACKNDARTNRAGVQTIPDLAVFSTMPQGAPHGTFTPFAVGIRRRGAVQLA